MEGSCECVEWLVADTQIDCHLLRLEMYSLHYVRVSKFVLFLMTNAAENGREVWYQKGCSSKKFGKMWVEMILCS
jgi:hypothetical protein